MELVIGSGGTMVQVGEKGISQVDLINTQRGMRQIRNLRVYFENGLTLSCSWGSYSYSDNYMTSLSGEPINEQPTTVEIAVLTGEEEDFVLLPNGGQVMGYIPVTALPGIVAQIAAMTSDTGPVEGLPLSDYGQAHQEYDEMYYQLPAALALIASDAIEIWEVDRGPQDV